MCTITYETNNKYLLHYNKNHDKLGRFAKGPGGGYDLIAARRLNKKVERIKRKNDGKIPTKKAVKIANKIDRLKTNEEFSREYRKFTYNNRTDSTNIDKKIKNKIKSRIDKNDKTIQELTELGTEVIKNNPNIMSKTIDRRDTRPNAMVRGYYKSSLIGGGAGYVAGVLAGVLGATVLGPVSPAVMSAISVATSAAGDVTAYKTARKRRGKKYYVK